jgi:hypothetical protein
MTDPRPLGPEEQAVQDTVRDAARGALDAGRAQLELKWELIDADSGWSRPDFVLTPANPAACPLRVSPSGADWIDLGFGREGFGTIHELWAETQAERLALLRGCVDAVIDGHFEIKLARRRFLLGWTPWAVVSTFELPTGPLTYTRGPADPGDYRALFGDSPPGRVAGPHRFPPY